MSRATTDAFVRNLKLLNAKERDHLMRFAYLGQSAAYTTASTFLSDGMDSFLREHAREMGLATSANCVFAGMDYHLDWLFAALWMAKTGSAWLPQDGNAPNVPMGIHEEVAGIKSLYTDFRPITGSQEDIDFLAVYDDGNKLAVFLIEAKGSAAFDRVQLARKLIRLDRILVTAEVTPQHEQPLEFRLILAAPKEPGFQCCISFAQGLPEATTGEDKFRAMKAALKDHPSGIGKGLHFLKLPGFPEEIHAVERVPEAGTFTHWTLRKRK